MKLRLLISLTLNRHIILTLGTLRYNITPMKRIILLTLLILNAALSCLAQTQAGADIATNNSENSILTHVIYVVIIVAWTFVVYAYAKSRLAKKFEIKKKQMENEQFKKTSDTKLNFFSKMSRELSAPLTHIITPLQSLSAVDFPDDIKEQVDAALKNAQSLLHQVNMLLDYRNLENEFTFTTAQPTHQVVFVPLAKRYAAIEEKKEETSKAETVDVTNLEAVSNDKEVKEEYDERELVLKRALAQADAKKDAPQPIVATVNGTIDDSNAADAANQAWESTSAITNPESHRFTILMVDDAPDMCRFARDYFRGEYNVITANDGEQALTKLRENDSIDLIVSDITMPRMDGLQLCEAIKTNLQWSHIPVILLTGRTGEEMEVQGLKLGADDYITKPFNAETLRLRIKKFIEIKENRQKQFKEKMDIAPSEITITTVDEQFLQRAIKIVEEHMSDQEFSVEMLGVELDMSRTYLYKKLMNITGKGPAEFIRIIRLKRGKHLLELNQMQITEIAYTLGYSSPKRFTENFKAEFGMSPSEYIKKLKAEGRL